MRYLVIALYGQYRAVALFESRQDAIDFCHERYRRYGLRHGIKDTGEAELPERKEMVQVDVEVPCPFRDDERDAP